jgi:RHS repeat-associated protein
MNIRTSLRRQQHLILGYRRWLPGAALLLFSSTLAGNGPPALTRPSTAGPPSLAQAGSLPGFPDPIVEYRGSQVVLDGIDPAGAGGATQIKVSYRRDATTFETVAARTDEAGRYTLAFYAGGLDNLDEVLVDIRRGEKAEPTLPLLVRRGTGPGLCLPATLATNAPAALCSCEGDCPPPAAATSLFTASREPRSHGVNVADGTVITSAPVAGFDTGGLGMDLTLHHQSGTLCDGPTGQAWSHGYDMSMVQTGDNSGYVVTPDLRSFPIARQQASRRAAAARESWTLPDGFFSRLQRDPETRRWLLTHSSGLEFEFLVGAPGQPGPLVAIRDPNGNQAQVRRNGSGALAAVTTDLGQEVRFGYGADGRLASLTDHLGRAWGFGHDARGNLTTVTSPATEFAAVAAGAELTDTGLAAALVRRGRTTTFSYGDPALPNQITRITDARGAVAVEYTYHHNPPDVGRVAVERVNGRDITFLYDPPATAVPAPLGRLEPGNRVTRVVDRAGNVTDHEMHGPAGGPLQGMGKFGLRRRVVWTERGKGNPPLRAGEPLAWEQRWLQECDCLTPRAVSQPFRREAPDLAQDDAGRALAFDANGMPAGYPTEHFAYNDRRQVTAYELRSFGEVIRWEKTYDTFERFSRLVSYTEPRAFDDNPLYAGLSFTHAYAYDARGNRIRHQAPRVTRGVESAQTIVESWTYDARGQVLTHTDANGNLTRYAYFDGPSTGGDVNSKGEFGGYLASVTRGAAGSADPAPRLTTRYRVNALGMVTQRIDPGGAVHDVEYNDLGETTRQIDAEVTLRNGQRLRYETRFVYDAAGNRVLSRRSNVDFDGAVSANDFVDRAQSFDAAGNLLASRAEVDGDDAHDLVTRYRYDRNDRLAVVEQPEGNRTFHLYDERLLRFKTFYGVAPAAGGDPAAGYPADARSEALAGTGFVGFTSATYDARGNAVRVRDGRGNATDHFYDFADRRIASSDPNGNGVVAGYDDSGNVLTGAGGAVAKATGAATNVLERTYHRFDEAGRRYQTVRDLDPASDEGAAVDPDDGRSSSYRTLFDPASRVIAALDANGNRTTTTYDAANRVLAVTDPLGNARSYEYDADSNVVAAADLELPGPGAAGVPERYVATFAYDALDRRIESHDRGLDGDSLDHATRFAYDSRDNTRLVEDAEGNVARAAFDDLDRRVALQRFAGDPGAGAPPAGVAELTRVEHRYDRNSRRTHDLAFSDVADVASRQATLYLYDDLDRLTTTVYPDADDFRRAPDGPGYGEIDRGNPGGADGLYDRVELTYDASSNVVATRDQRGVLVAHTYDPGDRLVLQAVTLPPGIPGTDRQDFSYDALDRLVRARNNYARVSRVYDPLSRLAFERQEIRLDGSGFTAGWERPVSLFSAYDRASNRTSLRVRDATEDQPRRDLLVRHAYDELNRTRAIRAAYFDRPLHPIAEYAYLGPGRVQTKTFGNGAVLTDRYDAKRRLAEHAWRDGPPPRRLLAGFGYAYDDVDNPLFERFLHDGGRADNFAYNDRYELTGVSYRETAPRDYRTTAEPYRDTFDYDDAWNRREARFTDPMGSEPAVRDTYQINRANEYLAVDRQVGGAPVGTSPPLHDAAGNLTRLPVRPVAGAAAGRDVDLHAVWDAFDLLHSAAVPDPGREGGERVEHYRYDPFRRRIAKLDVARPADGSTARLTVRRFIYDGWRDVAERVFEQEGGTEIPAGIADRLERVYVNGRVIDEPLLAAIDADGDRDLDGGGRPLNSPGGTDFEYHYLTNRLGSVVALLEADDSGRVLEAYRYDVYGQAAVLGLPADAPNISRFANAFTFTARRLDAETGLLYLRNRYLDPTSGRFLARDPIASAGKLDLYAYALCSPVRWLDPSGLDTNRISGTGVPHGGGTFSFFSGETAEMTGTVKVYRDVTIEYEGNSSSGWIQLEFTSDYINCAKCRWLQLVRFDYLDKNWNPVAGVFKAPNGLWTEYNRGLIVDSTSSDRTDPFYKGQRNELRDDSSIFDAPTMRYPEHPDVTRKAFVFDAYLICDGKVYWRVHWELVMQLVDRVGGTRVWSFEYETIFGQQPTELPSVLKEDELPRGFQDYDPQTGKLSNPETYDNPIAKEHRK